jgi:hypothetical protein
MRSLVVALLAMALALALAVPEQAHSKPTKRCPRAMSVSGAEAIGGARSRIIAVTRTTCRRALRLVRTYGVYIASPGAFQKGGRFSLGSFRCTVIRDRGAASANNDLLARCALARKSFRVAYGANSR